MAGMEVGAGAFDFAISTVNGSSDNLTRNLNAIRGVIEGARGIWKGAAAATFQQLMTEWDQDVNNTIKALTEYVDKLNDMKRGYGSTEEEAASRLKRTTSAGDYSGSF